MSEDVAQTIIELTPPKHGEDLDPELLGLLKAALRPGSAETTHAATAAVVSRLRFADSRTRLRALLLCNWLFLRSRGVRELLVPLLPDVLACTLGTSRPLPKPQRAAERLQELSRSTFATWASEFGAHYTQLVVAHHLAAEQPPARSVEAARADAHLQSRYESLVPQLPALFSSVRSKLAQLDATVALLCSRSPLDADADEEWVDVGRDDVDDVEPPTVPAASSAPGTDAAEKAAVRDAVQDSMAEMRRDAMLLDDAIALLTRVQSGAARGEVLRDAIGLKSAISTALKTARALLSGGDTKGDDQPQPAPAVVAPVRHAVPRVADAAHHHIAVLQTARGNGPSHATAPEARQSRGNVKRPPSVRDRIVKKLVRRMM